jgi:hypothetical protein
MTLVYNGSIPVVFRQGTKNTSPLQDHKERVVIFDNFDPDFQNPPFGDKVTIMSSNGVVENTIQGFNIGQTISGRRSLSVSSDGNYFVVCESVGDKLSKFGISGNLIFSVNGSYAAAVISGNLIYALVSYGNINTGEIHIINSSGAVTNFKDLNGFDIVVDQ